MSDLKNGVFLVPNDERFVNYTAYVKFLGIDHMMWISNMKLKESSTPESRRMRHWADCPLDTSADTRVKLSDAFRDVLALIRDSPISKNELLTFPLALFSAAISMTGFPGSTISCI